MYKHLVYFTLERSHPLLENKNVPISKSCCLEALCDAFFSPIFFLFSNEALKNEVC